MKTIIAFVIIAIFVLCGCNPTKYVPNNKYLLNAVNINIHNKAIDTKELKSYARQSENKKLLGFRFHLWLYNLSDINKKKGIHKYLQKVGEEPILWDADISARSVKQMQLYLTKRGYYNATVFDSVIFRKKKAEVTYFVNTNKPYIISNISYVFDDTIIRQMILGDTINSKIKRGNIYDEDVLQNERIRIEYLLRNNGFFYFNRDFIWFEPDSSLNSNNVNIEMHFKGLETKGSATATAPQYRKYKINKVLISTENDVGVLHGGKSKSALRDTVSSNGIKFIYQENFWVRPNVIMQSNYIFPGAEYKISDEEETKNHLFSLSVFSIVRIQFTESEYSDTSQYQYLDCQIRLSPVSMQSYSTEIEGTHSSGNGLAVNLVYQHKSLFGNAENFSLKLRGALESIKSKNADIQIVHEYGAEASISLPKFLIPINRLNFVKKYNPKTSLSVSYNFQQRVQYTRTVANASFGYNWKSGKFSGHSFRPIELTLVDIPRKTPEYDSIIKNTFLSHTFYAHLITSTLYSYTFNNQRKGHNFQYFRCNVESAGNLLNTYNKLAKTAANDSSNYELFGIEYSQYIKTNIDYHYFHYISNRNSIVYRVFAGIAFPLGNSNAVPFEKQYFAGGANSIRGWQVYRLGPGSSKSFAASYPDRTGDIKLESNVEYRFKMFWVLEGALFIDAGNIWTLSKIGNQKEGQFAWDKFYKDIAIGSGVGMRFDFGFVLFRVDLGMKVRNPALDNNAKWFYNRGKPQNSDFALSIAINYPF